MRILIYSWRDPKHPLSGGAEQVVHEHCKGWIKSGHKVTLFSSRFKESKESEFIDGVKVFRKGYQYLGVQLAGYLYYQKNKQNFDMVIDQFHGLPFFTPLYVRKPKIALIQETARKVWFLNPLPFPLNWIIGILGYVGEPFIFLMYRWTQFATGSESAKDDVSRLLIPKKNITVWPHGVKLEKIRKTRKEKISTIIYLGILSKDKGIEDALICFSKLNKQGNYNFWVIGKPETEEYGKKIFLLSKMLDLNNLTFWGFLSQKKKYELLSRAHILVNPSTREGWGLVNIEANSAGTPVVAYNNAGLVDSIKNGTSGILTKKNNPEELAENIKSLLQDKKRYSKLQKGAIDWSKRFKWGKLVKVSLKHLVRVKGN